MGNTSDKASGIGNEALGKIKQVIGKMADDDKLRAEGAGQEIKGKGQQALGEAKDNIKDAVEKASEAVERKLDYVLTADTPDLRQAAAQVAAQAEGHGDRNQKYQGQAPLAIGPQAQLPLAVQDHQG